MSTSFRLFSIVPIIHFLALLALPADEATRPVLAVVDNPLVQRMYEVKQGSLYRYSKEPLTLFKQYEVRLVPAKAIARLDPPADLVLEMTPGRGALGSTGVTGQDIITEISPLEMRSRSTRTVWRKASATAFVNFRLYAPKDPRRSTLAGVATGSQGGEINAEFSRNDELAMAYNDAAGNVCDRIEGLAAKRILSVSKLTAVPVAGKWTLQLELKNPFPFAVSGRVDYPRVIGLVGVGIEDENRTRPFFIAPDGSHTTVLEVIMPTGVQAPEKQIAARLQQSLLFHLSGLSFGAHE